MGSRVEARAVCRELGVDGSPTVIGVALGRVDDVEQQPRALEVREELVAEADALARALDQPWDIGDDELPPVRGLDRPENGRKRRERIIGDLRPRIRDAREERGLARVRKPDERGVGEQLQTQLDLPLLTGHADLGEPRRLPRRAGEVLVAASARTAARDDDARLRMREVGDEPAVRVDHLRPDRDVQHRVLAAGAVREASSAGAAAPRVELLIGPEAGQVAPPRVGDEHHVPAAAAVATVRTAPRHELLAAEVDRPVPTAASLNKDARLVVKHHTER